MDKKNLMFMGDVHGDSLLMEPFLNSNCKTLIQLGDFGFVWKYNDIKYNKFIRKFQKEYPEKEILFVPGNHENYDAIFRCPLVRVHSGMAYKISNNIFALRSGEIYDIDGIKIFPIRGAWSVDQACRIPGVSWWDEEQLNSKEMGNVFNRMRNLPEDETIDYVISHTAPKTFISQYLSEKSMILAKENYTEDFLNLVLENASDKVKHWYFGHWHDSFAEKYHGIKVKLFNIGEFIEV